jgi:hypothetical protein
MRRFKTVVPMHNLHLGGPSVQFGPGVYVALIPDWLRADGLLKNLSQWDLARFEACTHCFVHEYEAEALGSPDPLWKGPDPRSIQDAKIELSYLANLALWLQRPGPIGFNLIFHAPEWSSRFSIQGTERCDRYLCHPGDSDQKITSEDIEPASKLYGALTQIPRHSAPWTAISALIAALQMNREEIRHLLLWVALEALFGPEDGREITYRLSQRLALFLATNRTEARELFGKAKRAYGFRSKVAHGKWKHDDETTAMTGFTEALLRRSLLRLMRDGDVTSKFLGQQRETYLDDLPFSEQILGAP